MFFLFHGKPTFVGYLMPKPFFKKGRSETNYTLIAGGKRGLHTILYIYAPLSRAGLRTLLKELTAATHVMQSSPKEETTLVSDNTKFKQTKATTNVQ